MDRLAREREDGRRGHLVFRSVQRVRQGGESFHRRRADLRSQRPPLPAQERFHSWNFSDRGGPMSPRSLLLCVFGGMILSVAPVHAQSFVITNARIHTVSGPVIPRGTIVVRNGLIVQVGADVPAPPGVPTVDAAGKVVTPGFMDSNTALGTTEIGLSADGTVDVSSNLDRITAAFNPLDNLNPFSTLIPVTRVEGITRAVVAPAPGASFIAGQGLIIDLGATRTNITV